MDRAFQKVLSTSQGCPANYPLVVCTLVGNGHGSHDAVANPAFSTFLQSLAAP